MPDLDMLFDCERLRAEGAGVRAVGGAGATFSDQRSDREWRRSRFHYSFGRALFAHQMIRSATGRGPAAGTGPRGTPDATRRGGARLEGEVPGLAEPDGRTRTDADGQTDATGCGVLLWWSLFQLNLTPLSSGSGSQ